MHWKDEQYIKNFSQKPKRNRQLGRSRHRWDDNITVNLKSCEGMEWIHLSQNRAQWQALVNTVMNLKVS
jgi:hypothetical protein